MRTSTLAMLVAGLLLAVAPAVRAGVPFDPDPTPQGVKKPKPGKPKTQQEPEPLPIPESADPEDIRALVGARDMLIAERRLKQWLKAGRLKGLGQLLTFEQLSSWPYEDGLKGAPKSIRALDGKKFAMVGFLYPIEEVENIREFLLVQSLWGCCYGVFPPLNAQVRVVMQGKKRTDYQFGPIVVRGTLKVESTLEEGYCIDIYQLHATHVDPARKLLKDVKPEKSEGPKKEPAKKQPAKKQPVERGAGKKASKKR